MALDNERVPAQNEPMPGLPAYEDPIIVAISTKSESDINAMMSAKQLAQFVQHLGGETAITLPAAIPATAPVEPEE